MTDKRRIYKQEFKDSTVQMVLAGGKSRAKVARELGIENWRARAWVIQAKKNSITKDASGQVDKNEYDRLKREHKRLQEENEILKKQRRSLRSTNAEVRMDTLTPLRI